MEVSCAPLRGMHLAPQCMGGGGLILHLKSLLVVLWFGLSSGVDYLLWFGLSYGSDGLLVAHTGIKKSGMWKPSCTVS